MPPKFLITVAGPTAIGKTALAIALAKHYKTEIVSADSRQFYREMTIGTAVPKNAELKLVPHHFIQHRSIFEPYSVGDFERDALAVLDGLFNIRDTVILVGGSGLYVDAVTKGLDDFPDINPGIRSDLKMQLETEGIQSLRAQLKGLDPTQYSRIDLDNPQRLIRALEVCIGTAKPYSSYLNQQKEGRPFQTIVIGISADRKTLYDRINNRVDLMLSEGLLAEAETLYPHRELNALQTVGYRELFRYFKGDWELQTAISEIKKNTRRYAKRQLTWLRKNKELHWVSYEAPVAPAIAIIDTRINATYGH